MSLTRFTNARMDGQTDVQADLSIPLPHKLCGDIKMQILNLKWLLSLTDSPIFFSKSMGLKLYMRWTTCVSLTKIRPKMWTSSRKQVMQNFQLKMAFFPLLKV